jgi:hypothetical protein
VTAYGTNEFLVVAPTVSLAFVSAEAIPADEAPVMAVASTVTVMIRLTRRML